MTTAEPRKQSGDLVAGEYRLQQLIGSGAFARVYSAVQCDLDRRVAVKLLRPETTDSPDSPSHRAVERFRREAKLVSRLEHPNTVELYDYGRLDEHQFYMVLEYVSGRTLADLVEEVGPLGANRTIHILKQILRSLREAHAREIIHRDVKASNIMVFDRIGRDDCVKVLDFGVAKSVAVETRGERDLTAEGAAIGTPRYMSPEQLQGHPLSPKSDLFSVGILAHLMFAGRLPYQSNTPSAILGRMKEFDEDLGGLEHAPDPLRSVGAGLLTPSVEERLASADEALDLLDSEEISDDDPIDSNGERAEAVYPMGLSVSGSRSIRDATPLELGELERVDTGELPAGFETAEVPSESSDPPVDRNKSRPEREDVTTATRSAPRTEPSSSFVRRYWMGIVVVMATFGAAAFFLTSSPSPETRGGPAAETTQSAGTAEATENDSPTASDESTPPVAPALQRSRRSIRAGLERAAEAASTHGSDESSPEESNAEESPDRAAGSSPPAREESTASADRPDRNERIERGAQPTDEQPSTRGSSSPSAAAERVEEDERGTSGRDEKEEKKREESDDQLEVTPFDEKTSTEDDETESEGLEVEAWE